MRLKKAILFLEAEEGNRLSYALDPRTFQMATGTNSEMRNVGLPYASAAWIRLEGHILSIATVDRMPDEPRPAKTKTNNEQLTEFLTSVEKELAGV